MLTPYHQDHDVTLHQGDAATVLAELPEQSVNCVVTSPPYFGLRDYGVDGQLGLEPSPAEYVAALVDVFRGVRRVLRDDGVAWLNLGDSYSSISKGSGGVGKSGLMQDGRSESGRGTADSVNARAKYDVRRFDMDVPQKNLLGIPWRVAFALQDEGWTLRNAVIWHKPNAMPESVTDRLSCRYEHVFLFSKSRRYWFDLDPIREAQSEATVQRLSQGPVKLERRTPGETRAANSYDPASSQRRTGNRYGEARPWANSEQGDDHDAANLRGRNPGDVWAIPTSPFPGAHFATMPPALARRCILAGCPEGGTVLDPFTGSGTTGMVARQTGRKFVGIDLNAAYLDIAVQRIGDPVLDFGASA